VGNDKTEMTVIEYGWSVGQMMEMSKMGMEQCLNVMVAIFKVKTGHYAKRRTIVQY
jgi:hypothetical protein